MKLLSEAHLNTDHILLGQRGAYRVVSALALERSNNVYLGTREHDGLPVAIKFETGTLLELRRRARFSQEISLLKATHHPQIAAFVDESDDQDNRRWFAMEYFEGERIDIFCSSNHLRLSDRMSLFKSVCHATLALHASGIIHCDLNASNIAVKSLDEIKLFDLGISRLRERERESGTVKNRSLLDLYPMSVDYSSPEQVNGEPLDCTTDIYSLGVLFYLLLTDCLPYNFLGKTRNEITSMIILHYPPLPSTHFASSLRDRGSVTEALASSIDDLIFKMMHKNRLFRFTSVTEIIKELNTITYL